MRETLLYILIFFSFENTQAQKAVSKNELKLIFKETLKSSRNFVSNARNEWCFDNSNNDYFDRDTIVLNSARSIKRNYCKIIDWSFYTESNFILEKADYCNEPPTKKVSKNEDFLKLKIISIKNETYIETHNLTGLFEKFRVIEVKNNKNSKEKDAFDYTMKLLRIKNASL